MIGERLALIGVPTSAGAFASGQEQAPAALREVGLIELLREAGVDVNDRGDREAWRWRPDRVNPRAQNLAKVIEIVTKTARRVTAAVGEEEAMLVLGGTVAGHVSTGERVACCISTCTRTSTCPTPSPGCARLDGPGANAGGAGSRARAGRGRAACAAARARAGGPLRLNSEGAEPGERDAVARLSIEAITVEEVRAGPSAAAARALELIGSRAERLLVHFDVDVIDFTDTPLSENPGRNEGLPYADAIRALDALLASALTAGMSLTELNPNTSNRGREASSAWHVTLRERTPRAAPRGHCADSADLVAVAQAGGVEHVGARALVCLEAGDRVVEVAPATDVVLRPRGEREREADSCRRLGRGGDALSRVRRVVDLAGIRVPVLDRSAHRAGLRRAGDRRGGRLGVAPVAVLEVTDTGSSVAAAIARVCSTTSSSVAPPSSRPSV